MSVFDAIRDHVTLDQIVSANGSDKAYCVAPDHQDNDPSMHLYEDHVHCFSCGFHGDVTDVWAAMRGFSRPVEAALDLAQEWGIQLPEFSEETRQKLEASRHQEAENHKKARGFHEALEKPANARVREWWEGRGFGPDLQARFLLGASSAATAAIPFWHRGRVKGIIRRPFNGKKKYILPTTEEFVDGHRPLFIPSGVRLEGKGGLEIFVVEGYVDALAVAAAGMVGIAVGGTDASANQVAEMEKLGKFYILPDRDDSGTEAATRWARNLYPGVTARICPADYGAGSEAKDIADLFAAEDAERVAEHLGRLVLVSQDILDIEMENAKEIKDVRERLTYASRNIAPLLAPVRPEGFRDATADIVADTTKLKKSWLTKAIKDEDQQQFVEELKAAMQRVEEEQERQREEYRAKVAEVQDEIDELLAPGVLARLRDTAAEMHSVYGDREPLELALLVALGAQLEPLPNGRPLGASILLTATAGRGKNHIVDAAVKPLPPEFYFAFEIASGQSLYYKAEEDPDFLRHTFAYPNEIEGAETLWEFLRPMLSKGRAKKIVTAKDADGNMITKTIIVEGPVTIAIPTIRNKTDEQLQTRLLVAEMPDYVGRVAEHSRAVSEQLLPDASAVDYSREQWVWQEALRQLADARRVVLPLRRREFTFDNDEVSHGARLWANLLSLMVTNAWLEQRNRSVVEIGEDRVAIIATPEDYEVAYRIFAKVCSKGTILKLKEVHQKILGGLHDLHNEYPARHGFTQREVAKAAGVALSTVSDNKTYLISSAKLMKEVEGEGLALVMGAEPSWWEDRDLMNGLPTPRQVRQWWEEQGPDRDPPPNRGDRTSEHAAEHAENGDTYAGNSDRQGAEQEPNAFGNRSGSPSAVYPEGRSTAEHVRQIFGDEPNSEDGIGKPKTGDEGGSVRMFGGNGGSPPPLTADEVQQVRQLIREGMGPKLAREEVLAKRGGAP